jgi:hypothetical protein
LEHLVEIAKGSKDIVVGISGFGSAGYDFSRWKTAAQLTGCTTFVLRYDAQTLPWPEGVDWFPPDPEVLFELGMRWRDARKGAKTASKYLSGWLHRWDQAGRRVLLLGFSLGAYVAWNAVLSGSFRNVDVVFLLGAVGEPVVRGKDFPPDRLVVNLFSSDDSTLKYVYPHAVGFPESPAVGTKAVDGLVNVDVTDLVRTDHSWGSYHLPVLIRSGLGWYWLHRDQIVVPVIEEMDQLDFLSDATLERLYRWMQIDNELSAVLGQAVFGQPGSVEFCRELDAWSLQKQRLSSLMDIGRVSDSLREVRKGSKGELAAIRSMGRISGFLHHWLEESFESVSSGGKMESNGSDGNSASV